MGLPRFRCHKVVEAFKITAIGEFVGDNLIPLLGEGELAVKVSDAYMRKHNPQVGGYYVRYQDGYESWSPAEAFETGYRLMREGDTAVLMPIPGTSPEVAIRVELPSGAVTLRWSASGEELNGADLFSVTDPISMACHLSELLRQVEGLR